VYKDKTVLITGGTGSWGHELTRQLLAEKVGRIIVFSRGELAQVKMARRFNDTRMSFMIGDVRDRKSVDEAMYQDVDMVFHLAALKHVPVCERQPLEAVKTNIHGTQNVCDSAMAYNVERVIDVSTDKAVAPVNVYGMTKAVGERIAIDSNRRRMTRNPVYTCIRAGNVIGSNGSAIPLFIDQVKKYNRITLTDERMTRYFMTIEGAVGLVRKGAEHGVGGEIFVTKMPAWKMRTIAEVIAEHYGNAETRIDIIGIRPGEKLDEVLISKDEARMTRHYSDDYYVILPSTIHLESAYEEHVPFEMEEYSSATFLSDKDCARNELMEAGCLV
jgi:UDP-N-acetylglucosamine 4,6-dehydratase